MQTYPITTDFASQACDLECFIHELRIEYYFRNGEKKLFQFRSSQPYKMSWSDYEEWSVKCEREVKSGISKKELALTIHKSFITEPGKESTEWIKSVPLIHLNEFQTMSAFI